MTTQISSKFSALAIALMMNSLLIGGVAYLFDSQVDQQAIMLSLAQRSTTLSDAA